MTRSFKLFAATLTIVLLALAALPCAQAQDAAAVNLILKNVSEATLDVELVDQYGGNFTATIDSGMSQNQTLQAGSEVKVGDAAVHVVSTADEGLEIEIAAP